jgi:hypothetical protein
MSNVFFRLKNAFAVQKQWIKKPGQKMTVPPPVYANTDRVESGAKTNLPKAEPHKLSPT